MKTATRNLSLAAILVGVLIGPEGASEAGLITYSLGGYENVGSYTPFGPLPTAFDHVSISMTVDTSTITNDPTQSFFSPAYATGTALATISVSDASLGELTTTLMAHAEVSQVFASSNLLRPDFYTEIEFFADSGPSLGFAFGGAFIPEPPGQGPPFPVTYDLKSSIGPAYGVGSIDYEVQTSQGPLDLGVTRPDDPTLFNLEFQATVPGPSSLALCGIAGATGLAVAGLRRRTGSRG